MDTIQKDSGQDSLPVLVFATHNPNKVRELQEMLVTNTASKA